MQDDIINLSNTNIKDELLSITENIKKEYESGSKSSHEVPKEDKILDFLSSAGKVSNTYSDHKTNRFLPLC